MTPLGESLLRKELKKLKTVDRSAVVKAIAQAREFGDLKENAEYHAVSYTHLTLPTTPYV